MAKRGRPRHPELLTPREQEVLALVREGLTNPQIAERLGIGLEGVKYHVSEILSKLQVSSREEAARWNEGTRPWWMGAIAFWRPPLRAASIALAGGVVVAAVVGLVVMAVLLWKGSGDGGVKPADHVERTPPDRGDWTLEEVKRFDDFDVYWVGEEFAGVPLTRIIRQRSPSSNEVILLYGTCEPQGEGGCSPPIQLIQEPYCSGSALNLYERLPFRGGAEISRAEIESGRHIYTGDVAIKIYAKPEVGGPVAVADTLVAMNGDAVRRPEDPLPAIIKAFCAPPS